MPANRPSNPYQAPRPGKPAQRDSVAEDLVRSWTPDQRARIGQATTLLACYLYGPREYRHSPEIHLVGLIDKVNEEEKVA